MKLSRAINNYSLATFAILAVNSLPQAIIAQDFIAPNQPIIIEREINGAKLRMVSEPNHAGAFTSMTYRGQEYIDRADHGRLFQGAIAYNGRFECNNPTQAGASRDEENWGKRSTSKRLSAYIEEGNYFIVTQMAYWLRPNQECTIPGQGKSRVDNKKRLSTSLYMQTAEWNIAQYPNINSIKISYNTSLNIFAEGPRYDSAVVEALTIHTPPIFRQFDILKPDNNFETIQTPTTPDETANPIILSTIDGSSAIGFYGHDENYSYARWQFPFISKISLVYRMTDGFERGIYKAFWIIGTREEVKKSMLYLRSLPIEY